MISEKISSMMISRAGGGGGKWVHLGILGGGVTPGSPNSDPISEQEMSFLTPVFRPGV